MKSRVNNLSFARQRSIRIWFMHFIEISNRNDAIPRVVGEWLCPSHPTRRLVWWQRCWIMSNTRQRLSGQHLHCSRESHAFQNSQNYIQLKR